PAAGDSSGMARAGKESGVRHAGMSSEKGFMRENRDGNPVLSRIKQKSRVSGFFKIGKLGRWGRSIVRPGRKRRLSGRFGVALLNLDAGCFLRGIQFDKQILESLAGLEAQLLFDRLLHQLAFEFIGKTDVAIQVDHDWPLYMK